MFNLIKTLTELYAPVGQEKVVLDYVADLWQAAGATIRRSNIGNVVAHAGGNGKKLLLIAHADELCYLVRSIDEHGFVWLANGQAWNRTTSSRNLFAIGQAVQLLAPTGNIPGVIASATGHLATIALPEPSEWTWNDFWVDTGLSHAELVERGVTAGTRVVWDATTRQFGKHVVGKALDDRVPIAVITEVLRRVPVEERAWDLTLVCSVQEEIGVIGASALAHGHDFAAAIVVEIGMAGDIPTVSECDMPLKLGAGPALIHKDALVHYDHALTMALQATAKAADIRIQHAVFGSFGSDGVSLMRADIPAALVAFPTRYTHSPFETAHLGDIEQLVDWLCAFVRGEGANA